MLGRTPHSEPTWTAERFFNLLQRLGPLRIVTAAGPSVFDARCEVGPRDFTDGALNIVTPDYHWNLALDRFRHLRSVVRTHPRSGNRTAFFELRDDDTAEPFLRIYLSAEAADQPASPAAHSFEAAHAALQRGADVALEPA